MINVVKIILFELVFLGVVFSSGIVYHYIVGMRESVRWENVVSRGLVFFLAFFEVLFLGVIMFTDRFSILYFIALLIFVGIVLVAVFLVVKKEIVFVKTINEDKSFFIDLCVVFVVIGLSFFLSSRYCPSPDNGYYIAISNEAVENDLIMRNDTISYTGDSYLAASVTRPSINSYEVMIGVLSRLIGIHPAIVVNSALPFILIPIFIVIAKEVFLPFTNGDKRILYASLFVFSLMILLWDGARAFVSPFFSVHTGNGKAILQYAIIPLATVQGLNLYGGKHSRDMWIQFALLPLAAIAATATGVYTLPVYYVSFGMPYLIMLTVQKRKKELIRVTRNMFLCMLPVIPIGLFSLTSISIDTWSVQFDFDYYELMERIVKQSFMYIIMYLLALVILLFFCKKNKALLFFLFKFVMLCLFIYNPLVAPYVARYVTGPPVYDRLLYLNTVIFVIPIAVSCLLAKRKIVATIIAVLLLAIVLVNECFDKNNRKRNVFYYFKDELPHQNLYEIRNDIMEACYYFDKVKPDDEIHLLGDYSINKFFRQYSVRYHTVAARSDTIPDDDIGRKYSDTYEDIFENKVVSDKAMEGIDFFNVDYLVTTSVIDTNENFKLVFVSRENSLYVYERCVGE